jgi:hypothetical protein
MRICIYWNLADFFENKRKFSAEYSLKKISGISIFVEFCQEKKNTGVNWGPPELQLNPK